MSKQAKHPQTQMLRRQTKRSDRSGAARGGAEPTRIGGKSVSFPIRISPGRSPSPPSTRTSARRAHEDPTHHRNPPTSAPHSLRHVAPQAVGYPLPRRREMTHTARADSVVGRKREGGPSATEIGFAEYGQEVCYGCL